VWYLGADTEKTVPDGRLLSLLCSEERERHARLVFAADRDRYLLAHAALRLMVARYANVSASTLRFEANAHGRPEIVSPKDACAIRFNLSHTNGAIAIAVCRAHDVGVDIENHTREIRDRRAIARRFFSASEVHALEMLPDAEQQARFFQYWTLKESYIKARGLGLTLPLDAFSFEWPACVSDATILHPRIAIDPILRDAGAWHFLLASARPNHTIAAAVQCERPVQFTLRPTTIEAWVGE
jgi:4'-phosphopantetheinyl transferase